MMENLSRRQFLRTGALGAAAVAGSHFITPLSPLILRSPEEAVFRAYPPARMPAMSWAYASDEHEDPFKSSVSAGREGIVVPNDIGKKKFSVNTRWLVEGFGYLWLAADNDGEYYDLGGMESRLNLNYEIARSRVGRNHRVLTRYRKEGTQFSSEVIHLMALAEELLRDAEKKSTDGEQAARLADRSLLYALQVGERIELEKAVSDISLMKRREPVWIGCETRQYVWAKSEEFTKRFVELFNFATVTHYVSDTWYELFEPVEGSYNWGIKDDIVKWLSPHNVRLEGRPLFWFNPSVTPDWLKGKTVDQLKGYIERHTHDLVTHYGDTVREWEVFNEYHDFSNVHNHTPEQITELVRLALDKTKDVKPDAVRILNNCYPFGEYVARGRMAGMDATRPLRTVRKYLQDLGDAGVDYDVLGIQIYFPQRDLSDIVRLLERLSAFGKPVYITEFGASSGLPVPGSPGALEGRGEEPYSWRRPWDEDLQADWLEQMYTVCYSKPFIKAINWYDFSDFRPYIVNGGLVREDASTKQSFQRLKSLLASWKRLPEGEKERR
jgi:GH35 family endo-1,4-beta-xylanase